MQLDYLKIFVDLVETKSFSDAAKLNGITKAAVSKQVQVLERHFKSLLIDRAQKRFDPTSEGLRVYDCAKDILARYEKTVSELEDMKKTVSGSVRVATVASIGLHVLPPYLEKFQRAYPSVRLQILYRQSALVYKEILSNNADFGFVAFPVQRPEIETIPFLDDRLVLVVHPNHPLAAKRQVQFSVLAGQKFIGWLPGGPVYDVIAQICRDNKIKLDTTMQFDNSETVISAVEIGAGIALVPAMTAKRAVSRGSLVALEFKNREFVRPLAIIHRKGRVFMPAMRKFLEIMRTDLSRRVKAQ